MNVWLVRACFLPYLLAWLVSPGLRRTFARQCAAKGKRPGLVMANYLLLYAVALGFVLFCWELARAL
jgi:hypothetical protein